MKARLSIWFLALMLALTACDGTTSEARRMVKRAERLADTLPDSTLRLIDSVLHMPANFKEGERMDMAMLQAEVLFGDPRLTKRILGQGRVSNMSSVSASRV